MKRYKYLFAVAAIFGIMVASCDKNDVLNNNTNPPIQKAPAVDFDRQPYTYLQNKYIDLALSYEFKKQGVSYDSEKYSYDEKREIVDKLDLEKEKYEETKEDIEFYTSLEYDVMSEINSHHYVKKFVERFALKEFYDENEMMLNISEDDTDVISKFQLLQYYEDGFDIYERYLERETLSGEEEWSLFPVEMPKPQNSMQKAVRYTLVAKWGKTIEYLSLNASSTAQSRLRTAMNEWQSAANNKITFSQITKNLAWNKTCWVFGWKYFIRLSNIAGTTSYSTYGCVPWAMIQITSSPELSTCRHELGHSLLLYHEHQRPDRDTYITYYPNNVQSGYAYAFNKMTAGSYNYHGSTFDFNSIMLYHNTAFGKKDSNGNTLKTLTKKDGSTWTSTTTISATDKSVIQKIYP